MSDSLLDSLSSGTDVASNNVGPDKRFIADAPTFDLTSIGHKPMSHEVIERLTGRLRVVPTDSGGEPKVVPISIDEVKKRILETEVEPLPASMFISNSVVSMMQTDLNDVTQYNPATFGNASKLPLLPSVDSPITPVGDSAHCSVCDASNPDDASFCRECGSLLKFGRKEEEKVSTEASVLSWTPNSDLRAYLIAINDDGSEGKRIPIEFVETIIGRETDSPFPSDSFLSPKHARLLVDKGQLFIQDLNSFNGTFIKLRQERVLKNGDTFLMGRQVLCFEEVEQKSKLQLRAPDGTRKMGSPASDSPFRLLQIGIGGVLQNVYCLPKIGAQLGRERGDIIFPHDKFMSSRHAQIYQRSNGQFVIADLNSSNGTWIKICGLTPLETQDYIFMGQQLFRVFIDR